ncbi:hypothetical protein CELL_00186 [Cellulomonas sp. T2.31MG-18]|uniref:YciI family protein n=1 Tax=Cellulomonas sp. T2.31MG-18 TaxID=3157619 RepID=UPI0035E8A35C
MQFDTFVVARLLEGPNPPVLTEDGESELQDAHLAHIADLWASGNLIAAGPASGPEGLHGVSIFVCSLDRARELGDRDPAVVAGKYVHEYAVWRAPRSMIVPGSGIPPRSIAEVIGRAD